MAFFGSFFGLIIWNLFNRFVMSTQFGRHKLKNSLLEHQQTESLFNDFV